MFGEVEAKQIMPKAPARAVLRAAAVLAAALVLGWPQAGAAAEVWPQPAASPAPDLESPWDHPKGSEFVVTSRSFFFWHRHAFDEFEFGEARSIKARQAIIDDLVHRHEITILNPRRTVEALEPVIVGRGLIHDHEYGDGYLVMDYYPQEFH